MTGVRAAVRVEYAGFWRRFWAYLIDGMVLLLAWGVIDALTGGVWIGQIMTLLVIVYFVGLTVEGGTIGKRMLGLRVVRVDGTSVEFFRAALRELVGRPLSSFSLLMGYLWMLDQPERQTWHDVVANTVVVHELPTRTGPVWADQPPWTQAPRPVVPPPAAPAQPQP